MLVVHVCGALALNKQELEGARERSKEGEVSNRGLQQRDGSQSPSMHVCTRSRGRTSQALQSAEGRRCHQQMQSTTCCAVLSLWQNSIMAQLAAAAVTLQMLISAVMQGTEAEPVSHHVRHKNCKQQR